MHSKAQKNIWRMFGTCHSSDAALYFGRLHTNAVTCEGMASCAEQRLRIHSPRGNNALRVTDDRCCVLYSAFDAAVSYRASALICEHEASADASVGRNCSNSGTLMFLKHCAPYDVDVVCYLFHDLGEVCCPVEMVECT